MAKTYRDQVEIDATKEGVVKFLSEHRNGGLLLDIAEAMESLVMAATATGKGGIVTIAIGVKPLDSDGAMNVADDVKTKLPKLPTPASIMFATPNGKLMRGDHRQAELEIEHLPERDANVTRLPPVSAPRSL
ncbi:hypothetical protein Gdia_2477 [Gluconacetobacter diazotrophicus PA1 5]|uniref:hypothetical protein n=1 Tax=Gluconacetobacter diazotrophicus TaxID=33996 RepID=UPI000173DAC1|nr:hypothetical protein [Gluconacetobacter diazotrophicus]ACI52222.1 hypothetical protein Gdia_2477 [Gluconacetobacter diazotrophicus PA1 5]TWB00452.1 hypothetical protein FBZ86_13632 [Gluconacetobacter diazotrophicus]